MPEGVGQYQWVRQSQRASECSSTPRYSESTPLPTRVFSAIQRVQRCAALRCAALRCSALREGGPLPFRGGLSPFRCELLPCLLFRALAIVFLAPPTLFRLKAARYAKQPRSDLAHSDLAHSHLVLFPLSPLLLSPLPLSPLPLSSFPIAEGLGALGREPSDLLPLTRFPK